jgi:putative transposase
MSKPPRDYTSFGSDVYFVTASTWGHRSLFQTDRMARLFADTLFHYRRERKFLLHEFVIMPDHFHALITPTGVALEKAMQFIKGGFSYRVKKELGLNIEIWERGYIEHRIRDANDYSQHVEYIRQNPVKARVVSAAEDYPYCSAHGGVELDLCPQGLKPQILENA